ncbi:MAG: hypothetical protein Q9M24_06560 [Mariprofundaceae bacterium]|nr:hypothetical protein [Mariprofundaceae bacterium]
MLSSGYFQYRWSWYKPILNRGENPASRCRVDVRRLPLRMVGEDASEYIPYAIHSGLVKTLTGSVRKLQEYMVRYVVEETKVSAHQLPQPDATSRAMIQHLRKTYPHLPVHLLHHWGADEQGGAGLYRTLNGLWQQSWQQDQADIAPWVQAVNVLILKLLRTAIGHLPDEHAEQTDHVVMSVIGGMYLWALQGFLKKNVEGALEVTRISTYEAMIIPVTPMAFFHRQPEDALLGDARHIIAAYGLEPDIIPRMRDLRSRVGARNEAGILGLLGQDRMGDHLLKRSWARLSLKDLAGRSGQGGWMQWAMDAKRLDQLLARPGKACKELIEPLQSLRDHPFAAWLLDQIEGGRKFKKAAPWQHDEITLNAFRVFDEDVKVELARRKAERSWFDKRPELAGKGHGKEADGMLETAYKEGDIVFLQPDFSKSLHGGKRLSGKQACLRVEWSDYLAGMGAMHGTRMQSFLEQSFSTGILHLLEGGEGIFLDELSASGCVLRGPVALLMQIGVTLRRQLWEWYQDMAETGRENNMPAVSMCMAMTGDWHFSRQQHKKFGDRHIAFSLGLTQAASGVSRDCGAGRLIAYRDHKADALPLGGVRVETVDTGTGHRVQLLYNNGFAVTVPALTELTSSMRHKADVREYHVDRASARRVLRGFRLPDGFFDLIVIETRGGEQAPMFIVRVGKPCLGGVDLEVYEVLDPASEAVRLIAREGLSQWAHH